MNSPLGTFGPYVAAVVSLLIIGSAIAVHVFAILGGRGTATDPFLDSAALVVVGVVLGVNAAGGAASASATAAKAELEATAAHRRLDAVKAPTVPNGTGDLKT